MSDNRPRVLIFLPGGQGRGGPYQSHKRIMESRLQDSYVFIPCYFPRMRQLINPVGLFRLVREIRNHRPDIAHCYGLQLSGFFTVLACRLAGVKPIVLAIRGSSMEALNFTGFKRRLTNWLEIRTLKMASVVYGVSRYVVEWPRVQKYARRCAGAIYNLPQQEAPSDTDIRRELDIPAEDRVVVSTGRITKDKGYEILCDLMIRQGRQDGVHYILAGDGDYLETFGQRVREAGMGDRVHLLGHRQDVPGILNGCDLFVICSLHETLCNSLIEAGKAGLACVATRVGGIPEVVEDGVSGLLVPPGDTEAAREAVGRLLADENLCKEMGRRGAELIRQRFSEESITSQLDELYRGLLK